MKGITKLVDGSIVGKVSEFKTPEKFIKAIKKNGYLESLDSKSVTVRLIRKYRNQEFHEDCYVFTLDIIVGRTFQVFVVPGQ